MQRTTTTTSASITLLAATLLLTGCQGGAAQPSPEPTVTETTTVTPTPTPTGDDGAGGDGGATPEPTATAAPVATIPTDCTDIVDAAAYASTFGETPLNPAEFGDQWGQRTPTEPRPDAAAPQIARDVSELSCLWRDPRADITGIGVEIGRVTPDQAATMSSYVTGNGGACTEVHQGTSCQFVMPDPQYPVERTQTLFVRDGVVVYVDQTNFPTDDLLGSITARVWG